MHDFKSLKKSSSAALQKLQVELDKLGSFHKNNDDRIWYPSTDKAGNGSALIRFLPAPKGEDVPFVRIWSHSFKGPTGVWYIENCLSTIGGEDPVMKLNNKLWNEGNEDQARAQKRKQTFISNILVIKDPQNPANEGKVFLYKFGKKIFDKVNDMMHPTELDDRGAINPFDPWGGANFKVIVRQVDGYRNYDKSEFVSPSSLGDDARIEEIWNQEHSLQAFLAPDQFKSYAELQSKLERALGASVDGNVTGGASKAKRAELPIDDEIPFQDAPKAPVAAGKAPKGTKAKEEDSLEFFQSLVDEDEE